MIRWVLQIMAMLSDLIMLGMAIFIIYALPAYISLPSLYLMYKIWKKNGGHMAWAKRGREKFMRNAKQYGL